MDHQLAVHGPIEPPGAIWPAQSQGGKCKLKRIASVAMRFGTMSIWEAATLLHSLPPTCQCFQRSLGFCLVI